MAEQRTSRLSGLYKRSLDERAAIVADWANLTPDEQTALREGLSAAQADHMIENVMGTFALPLGIATNFLINDVDYLVPMVIEEPSVVAAASNAAKLFRAGGGFTASSDESIMIGQIQIVDLADTEAAAAAILENRDLLLEEANTIDPVMIRVGGGARDIQVRPFPATAVGPMLVMHLHYDCRDAMGANAINTTLEKLAPRIEQITGGRVNLRILSNLADQRKARAQGMIPAAELATDTSQRAGSRQGDCRGRGVCRN
jgi:hydroxymethylglutaryl-CoA reductase